VEDEEADVRMYDFKEKGGYWKLKEVTLDHTLWRTHFGRGYGPVIRQTE
jgi:hypothetical protein